MTADPARDAALQLLTAALEKRAGLETALEGKALLGLEPKDRAFARALAMCVLRRLGPIDRALAPRLQREPPPAVRMILRLGLAQLYFLDVPAFAALDTSVSMAERTPGAKPFKGLVNAVLRRLQRDGMPEASVEDFAPPWLFARWRSAYGEASAREIAALIAEEPATDLTPRDPAETAELAEALEAEVLEGGSMRRAARGRVEDWPGFAEGRWWAQDAAAAVPARLLAVAPEETALDLCAAPGGKTLQLAAAGARVTALDRSGSRMRRVATNLARTGLAAETVIADAAEWADKRGFDAVLLDAPCSATGTFRRNPDVLWSIRPADIAKLAETQAQLLDAAAGHVKPGGRLVYCVCSLEPEEGEAQAAGFLKRHGDFESVPALPGEGGAPEASLTPDGWLRLLPQHREGGQDGFFAARFRRKA